MISFLIGAAVSLVAALPAYLLMWGGRHSDLKVRLKLWAIGVAIRFALIGVALYLLFTQTDLARIPAVIGVAATYFALYVVEIRTALRS